MFDHEKLHRYRNNPDILLRLIEDKDKDLMNYIEDFTNKEENAIIRKTSYDIGIYTIGLSPYTLLLSLSVIQPKERVVLYYTNKSKIYSDVFIRFIEITGMKFDLIHEEMSSDSDTAEIYNTMEKSIKGYKNKKIAIDITGGKKPTIASGFLGATLHNKENEIDVIYVDFSEYINDNPRYGSEHLTVLLNPNDIFNTIERKALEELFQSLHFKGARRLSRAIQKRLQEKSKDLARYNIDYQLDEINRIYYFAKLYELRNDFNYKEMNINNNILVNYEVKGLSRLKKFSDIISKVEVDKCSDLNENNLSKNIYKAFKGTDLLLYGALERYVGAIRYKNIDLQSYILRLASVVELCGIEYTKGEGKNLYEMIKNIHNLKLRTTLHEMRILRNNLSLTHGFESLVTPKTNYENAVLDYILLAFNKDKSSILNIVNTELRLRNFEEVINGLNNIQ